MAEGSQGMLGISRFPMHDHRRASGTRMPLLCQACAMDMYV